MSRVRAIAPDQRFASSKEDSCPRFPVSTASSAPSKPASIASACSRRCEVGHPRSALARRRKYDGVVFEGEHNRLGHPGAARQPAVPAQPRADRQGGLGGAGRHADGAHSGQRRREEPVPRQAGARPRLPTASCGRISARSRRPITRSRPAAIRACKDKPLYEPAGIRGDGPTPGGALLGRHAAGILRRAPTCGRSTRRARSWS